MANVWHVLLMLWQGLVARVKSGTWEVGMAHEVVQ